MERPCSDENSPKNRKKTSIRIECTRNGHGMHIETTSGEVPMDSLRPGFLDNKAYTGRNLPTKVSRKCKF